MAVILFMRIPSDLHILVLTPNKNAIIASNCDPMKNNATLSKIKRST